MRLSFGAPDLRAIDFRFWDHRFSEQLVPESGATSFIGFQKLGCKPLIRFRHPSRSDPSLPIKGFIPPTVRDRRRALSSDLVTCMVTGRVRLVVGRTQVCTPVVALSSIRLGCSTAGFSCRRQRF
ncbi:hypothetical protein U1Q18_005969 [Sarracenia purpurea var. burkii]